MGLASGRSRFHYRHIMFSIFCNVAVYNLFLLQQIFMLQSATSLSIIEERFCTAAILHGRNNKFFFLLKNVLSKAKKIYCSCHATYWLQCSTSIIPATCVLCIHMKELDSLLYLSHFWNSIMNLESCRDIDPV